MLIVPGKNVGHLFLILVPPPPGQKFMKCLDIAFSPSGRLKLQALLVNLIMPLPRFN